MQRYFVKEFDYDENNNYYTDIFTLNNEDSYHLVKVMRKKTGDLVEIVCSNNVFICEILSTNNNVKCIVKDKLINNDNQVEFHITIAQSIVKEQKMDYILQKSCEFGVESIIPLNVIRNVVKVSNKEQQKINRWQKILNNASEQSKRITRPKICPVMSIKDLCSLKYDYKILCSVNQKSINIKKVLSNVTINDTILVVVGPEGGFTKDEENDLINSGFISVSLGNRVLRTESVSLFILSILNYIFMR